MQCLLCTNTLSSVSNLSNKEQHKGTGRPFISSLLVLNLHSLHLFTVQPASLLGYFSKANCFNARYLDENILRYDVITLSWKFIFFYQKQEQALKHLIACLLFTNLLTRIIHFWKRNRKHGLLILRNISHHYWLYVNKGFCYSTSLLNWITPGWITVSIILFTLVKYFKYPGETQRIIL